jgi:hypothetical protein
MLRKPFILVERQDRGDAVEDEKDYEDGKT